MNESVEDFKKRLVEEIRSQPERFFSGVAKGAVKPEDVTTEFASDAAIKSYLDGGAKPLGGVCCLVKAKIPFVGGYVCVTPPGGDPDNMCI